MGEYVFTTTGWHVPKPEDLSNGVTFIIAHPPSSKNFKTIVESLEKEGIVTHRTSLSLSLRKKGLSMEIAEAQRCLIVGITFLNLPAVIEKKCPTKQITEANVFVEYRLLRPFLTEATYLLKTINEGQDQSDIVETALQTVTRVMMSNGFVVQKEIPKEMELLSTFQKEPENVSESSEAFAEVMGDSDGDQMDTASS
ncbi:hypothetical protein BPAE_0043g00540 [Botrytis paeoniae]|uniref:Uncharacterized protein n=1 Tax=Botrytis paeoniae TaxID=278948 RepID=A0A4Z1FVP3_9HELO|nr:hypothetical protein BPAE_0043g00540 [Botrytis paeoniae]